VSTKVLNKFNPTHGGAYIKVQVKVYLQTHLLMLGSIFEKVFANPFYNPSDLVVLRKTKLGLPDSPSAVAQAHNHTLYQKTTHAMKNIPTQILVL
jgi:hypothetical protein